ncbi:MAG: MFS transporter, partial [Cyclobacteriaceae bacterium]|nr:MFS transporter [Cyclobacteriaceae bacterium HetDA_MAG_MS6]
MDRKRWANFPFHPGNWPFFYGWMILVWGSMGMLISIPGQTMGVSVFTDPLLSALDISRDQLSLAYMLGTIGSSFILPFAGRVFDRIGARFLAIVSSVGLGIILVFLSQIDVFLFDWLNITSSFAVILVLFSGFLFLRFFGQGVLTMSSRNMMAEWFEHRRGLATGFSNVFVSLGFSGAPVVLYQLIQWYDWKGAWLLLAFITGIVFPIIVFVFYRDRPEDSGLKPDGGYVVSEKKRKLLFPVIKEFSLREALANYSFWVLSLMLAMQGLYITGFTFHIVSIF